MRLKLVILLLAPLLLAPMFLTEAASSNDLKGKILLQVESRGEAWYVSPKDGNRYYMKDGEAALKLMREAGIGISNNNLKRIPIASDNLDGEKDSDSDGLSDAIEDALGTDKHKADSDNDGHNDKVEIINGYNPLGTGKSNHDLKFSKDQAGKILLQVENKGEAWYVNPNNNQRYFLGRPGDAYNLMRKLGLGITNNNLNKIKEFKEISKSNNIIDCGQDMSCFLKALETCEPVTVKNTRDINVFGMFIQNTTETTSLTGLDSSKKCGYSNYINDVNSLSYTQGMKEMIKASIKKEGKVLTEAEMEEALSVPKESLESAKSSAGLMTRCSFETNYLINLYKKWGDGLYSSSDITPEDCIATTKDGKEIPILGSSTTISFSMDGSSGDNESGAEIGTSSDSNGYWEIK